jgi:hypothetical protein
MKWQPACLRHVVYQLGYKLLHSHQGAEDISLLQNSQTDSGIHLFSCSVRITGPFRGVYRKGLDAEYSSPSNAEIKKERSCPPLVWFHGVHRDNFAFTPMVINSYNFYW